MFTFDENFICEMCAGAFYAEGGFDGICWDCNDDLTEAENAYEDEQAAHEASDMYWGTTYEPYEPNPYDGTYSEM